MAKRQVPRHPLVNAYVKGNVGICQTLEQVAGCDSPVLKAMRTLCGSLRGKVTFPAALSEAQSVVSDPSTDPELSIMFFSMWVEASYHQARVQEMAVLVSRAEALASSTTAPEILALVAVQKALLAEATGDRRASDRIRAEILDHLPKKSPRYGNAVWYRAMGLATHGEAAVMETDMDSLTARADGTMLTRVAFVRLMNAVETARFKDGALFLAQVQRDPEAASFQAGNLQIARRLLARMPQWLNPTAITGTPPESGQAAKEGDGQEFTLMLRVLDLLAERNPYQALGLVRQLGPAAVEECIRGSGLLTYNLVRAELSVGNEKAAQRIISLRQERGNHHYLDDLFLARVELLRGESAAAARHFALAMESCRRYRAEARLELELRLAAELSPLNLARMAAGAASPRRERGLSTTAVAARPAEPRGVECLVGRSPAMAAIRETVLRLASLEMPVLITGETGTGKELVARAIHESGPHADKQLIAVNCGALAETLLESELFGHQRGAFTGAFKAHRGLFEEAGQGAVLLDEIGETSLRLQVALLRVLETGEIRPVGSARSRRTRCRILAATNADLDALAARGLFRKDLLFRLRRMELHIPPLRERREDILPLTAHFLAEGRADGQWPEMSPELRDALLRRDWPGNVRELRGVVETMRLLNSDALSYGLDALEASTPPRVHPGREVPDETRGSSPSSPTEAPSASTPGDTSRDSTGPSAELSGIMQEGRTSLRRRERLRALFRQCRTLTRSEVVKFTKNSPTTVTADLKALCREGFIKRVEPSASTRSYYFVLACEPSGVTEKSESPPQTNHTV